MNKLVLVAGNKTFIREIEEALSASDIKSISESALPNILTRSKNEDVDAVILDGVSAKISKKLQELNKGFIVVSETSSFLAMYEAKKMGALDYIIRPYNLREFFARLNAIICKKKRIACIGGGTGLFHLLIGLKEIPDVLLTSIVSTSDDGGSSGKLKANFGILPPGDVRRSLVALSNAPEIMNRVMQYRFEKGDGINGHSFGNLFLAALTEIKGSLSEAVRTVSDILNVRGIVLPITKTPPTLCALFEDGTVIKGESNIDSGEGRDTKLHIKNLWHEHGARLKSEADAVSSILNSDFVLIGPGDLFTSIITDLLVKDINSALIKTTAKKIYICNVMTKPGETTGFDAFSHINEVVKYMGGDYLNYVIISNTKLSDKAIRRYSRGKQYPVAIGSLEKIRNRTKAKLIIADVGHEENLVRHDSLKLKRVIENILKL